MNVDGLYEIVDMEIWGEDPFVMSGPLQISIRGKKGRLHFINFDGLMDIETSKDRYLFTWIADKESDPVSGYGNFILIDGTIKGRLYVHDNYDSSFVAVLVPQVDKHLKRQVNRSILTITAKEPFMEWLQSLSGINHAKTQAITKAFTKACKAFIIPLIEDDFQKDAVLDSMYFEIFSGLLFSCCSDKTKWPQNRSLTLFKRWFHIEFYLVVEDISECDISDRK